MSPMSRGTPATDAYLDLKARARRENRSTQELLELYLLEGFLSRLAASELRDMFVLKGGVLLAAFGARRPTRDVERQYPGRQRRGGGAQSAPRGSRHRPG